MLVSCQASLCGAFVHPVWHLGLLRPTRKASITTDTYQHRMVTSTSPSVVDQGVEPKELDNLLNDQADLQRVGQLVELYDTTLRDGTQMEGISASVNDKLKISRELHNFGG